MGLFYTYVITDDDANPKLYKIHYSAATQYAIGLDNTPTEYPGATYGKIFSETDSYHEVFALTGYYESVPEEAGGTGTAKAIQFPITANEWERTYAPSNLGYRKSGGASQCVRFGTKLSSTAWASPQTYGKGTYVIYLGDDDCFYIIKDGESSGTKITTKYQGVLAFALTAGGGGGGGNPGNVAGDGSGGGGGTTAFGVLALYNMRQMMHDYGCALQFKIVVGAGGTSADNSSGSIGKASTISLIQNMSSEKCELVHCYGGYGGPQGGPGGNPGADARLYSYRACDIDGDTRAIELAYAFRPATLHAEGSGNSYVEYWTFTYTAGKGGTGYVNGSYSGTSGGNVDKDMMWSSYTSNTGSTNFYHTGGATGDMGRPGGGGASCFGNGGAGGAYTSIGNAGGTGAGGGGGRYTFLSWKRGGYGGDGQLTLYGCNIAA